MAKKIAKYRKPIKVNIAMVIFGFVFLYLVICVYTYLTSTHISAYEVLPGQLAVDTTYTGLIIREETVVNASGNGFVNYYVKEGEKVSPNSSVYTIDENGRLSAAIDETASAIATMSSDELSELRYEMSSFSNNYSAMDFAAVYDFNYSIERMLLEIANNAIQESLDATASDGFQMYNAQTDGVIAYSIDGLEDVTKDSFTDDMVHHVDYEKTNLMTNELVSSGNPVYKLITSEDWSVIIPLEDDVAAKLLDRLGDEPSPMTVRFLKDNTAAATDFSIMVRDGKYYGCLDLSTSMVRYASERYVEVDLLLDTTSGLKIPTSAGVEKEFYTAPPEFLTQGGDDNENGLLVEVFDEDGSSSVKFKACTIYNRTDEEVYIDMREFTKGDYIVKPDAEERYQIGATAKLQGVYNVNKGYAVFKQIEVLYENEDYCIIRDGTSFGLSAYDHIVLDGDAVEEDTIVIN